MLPGYRWVNCGKTAAEIGALDGSYRRFEQKNHLLMRSAWDEAYAYCAVSYYREGTKKRINKKSPGFGRREWALLCAATASMNALGFEFSTPNKGSNSWKPIPRYIAEGTPSPGTELEDWNDTPENNTRLIKHLSRYFGAADAGVCEYDRRWVYNSYYDVNTKQSYPICFSDEEGVEAIEHPAVLENGTQVIPARMKYAIVFVFEMRRDELQVTPRLVHTSETSYTYSKMANFTLAMAEYIRALGYDAIPSVNCTMQSIPLAIDAGLGETSRMGKLIHPILGPRCRICKIITDLPLVPSQPIEFGVERFCNKCTKCAQACPAKAISTGGKQKITVQDHYANVNLLQWPMQHDRCKKMFNKLGVNCGMCINSCPFNKPDHAVFRAAKRIVSKTGVLNTTFLKLDNLFGYGKPVQNEDYWNRI